MAYYRLRKPPSWPQPGAKTGPPPTTAPPMPAAPALQPTPPPPAETEAARRALVMAAFKDMYRVLEPVLGDQWVGAWSRISTVAPDVASATDEAERIADAEALAFIHGRGSELAFRRALGGYEMALRRYAATVLARANPRRRCGRCGGEEMTVALHTRDGELFCSRCWCSHAV